MSEMTGGEPRSWGPYVALTAAAAVAIAAVLASGGAAVPVAAAVILGFLGVALYIAAPRAARPGEARPTASEAAALAVPELAREILETLTDPILLLDPAGRTVFANAASLAIAGPDWQRKHISAVLRTPEVLEAVGRVLATGRPESVGFSIPVPVARHFEAHIARARADGLTVVLLRDLTAVRRAEELRADFVANASHELRTPLAALTGFIDTLRGHAKDDANARERFLDIMAVEASRMRRLIEDLLSLTRIELNEHNPPAGQVDLVSIVRDAADALQPIADVDKVRIAIGPHPPLVVTGDRDELTQVFQNLIHNAIKYGRPDGEVSIGFGRSEAPSRREGEGQAFVSVKDQGEGIPREAIPRLTERFYRVDVKRSRERGGTGLGLAIVKHILNRHHGRLHIESTVGSGSTFTVILPLSSRAVGKAA
jgi:two-component system, OmpR family, phosphate regulon sensor histidine kinase PhoR